MTGSRFAASDPRARPRPCDVVAEHFCPTCTKFLFFTATEMCLPTGRRLFSRATVGTTVAQRDVMTRYFMAPNAPTDSPPAWSRSTLRPYRSGSRRIPRDAGSLSYGQPGREALERRPRRVSSSARCFDPCRIPLQVPRPLHSHRQRSVFCLRTRIQTDSSHASVRGQRRSQEPAIEHDVFREEARAEQHAAERRGGGANRGRGATRRRVKPAERRPRTAADRRAPRRPPAAMSVSAARRPESIAGWMPSPLSGYASPAASPTISIPGPMSGRGPTPDAR